MTHPMDREVIDRQQRAMKAEAKLRADLARADFQTIMRDERVRRTVANFLADMGVDVSPFSTNAIAQSHAIGKQDAGRWWLDLIREHCPEREHQLRTEYNKVPPAAGPNEGETE